MAMVILDLIVAFVAGVWHIDSSLCGAEDSAPRQTLHCSEDSELSCVVDSDGWHIDSSSRTGTGGTSC